MSEHTHQCRDCGSEIDASCTSESCTWAGGNDGCSNCEPVVSVTAVAYLHPDDTRYQAVCTCGWKGKIRTYVSAAQDDGVEHGADTYHDASNC
jgi:hypothetical protein